MSKRLIIWAFLAPLVAPASAWADGPRPLIRVSDYPEEAIRHNHQGTVEFRITIGTNGRTKACTILKSSGYSELDAATCRVMVRRGRFQPARDENGKRVEDTYQSTVEWTLPR